jgi:hypothetical protein
MEVLALIGAFFKQCATCNVQSYTLHRCIYKSPSLDAPRLMILSMFMFTPFSCCVFSNCLHLGVGVVFAVCKSGICMVRGCVFYLWGNGLPADHHEVCWFACRQSYYDDLGEDISCLLLYHLFLSCLCRIYMWSPHTLIPATFGLRVMPWWAGEFSSSQDRFVTSIECKSDTFLHQLFRTCI